MTDKKDEFQHMITEIAYALAMDSCAEGEMERIVSRDRSAIAHLHGRAAELQAALTERLAEDKDPLFKLLFRALAQEMQFNKDNVDKNWNNLAQMIAEPPLPPKPGSGGKPN